MSFLKNGLREELDLAVSDLGWTVATGVQDEAIPLILGGNDVMIAAETGSGKTAAFSLPLLQLIYENLRGEANTHQIQETEKIDESITKTFILSCTDRDEACRISKGGYMAEVREPRIWAGCRGTMGVCPMKTHVAKEKLMFEVTVVRLFPGGVVRVGWSTANASLNLGCDRYGFGYGSTGKKAFGRNFEQYGQSFRLGDIIGVEFDAATHIISFSKNGFSFGPAYRLPPNFNEPLYPAVVLKHSAVSLNFGNSPFRFVRPNSTYIPLNMVDMNHISDSTLSGITNSMPSSPIAIIIEPTKDLVLQVYDEINKFKKYLDSPPISHYMLTGGQQMTDVLRVLKHGVHIIIGTPGRLRDLVKSGKLNLSETRYYILDEADSLVSDGQGKHAIMNIYKKLSSHTKQVVICSATLHSDDINKLANEITKNPQWVDLKGKDSVPDTVHHVALMIDPRKEDEQKATKQTSIILDGTHSVGSKYFSEENKLSLAVKLLKPQIAKKLIDIFKMEQCLIFCRTQLDCDNLEHFFYRVGGGNQLIRTRNKSHLISSKKNTPNNKFVLPESNNNFANDNPYLCGVLHGGRSSQERTNTLRAFKDGDIRLMICTDVAARGIDIAELPFVLNVTLPDKAETYIHRIGRVGRAGSPGLAISIVATVEELVWYHQCQRTDRGRGCKRTQLVDEGGCCIWYNEQKLLYQVEQRLGTVKIPHLQTDALLPSQCHGETDSATYIQQLAAKAFATGTRAISLASQKHLKFLRPQVEELYCLEIKVQSNFFCTQKHWVNRWKKRIALNKKRSTGRKIKNIDSRRRRR